MNVSKSRKVWKKCYLQLNPTIISSTWTCWYQASIGQKHSIHPPQAHTPFTRSFTPRGSVESPCLWTKKKQKKTIANSTKRWPQRDQDVNLWLAFYKAKATTTLKPWGSTYRLQFCSCRLLWRQVWNMQLKLSNTLYLQPLCLMFNLSPLVSNKYYF